MPVTRRGALAPTPRLMLLRPCPWLGCLPVCGYHSCPPRLDRRQIQQLLLTMLLWSLVAPQRPVLLLLPLVLPPPIPVLLLLTLPPGHRHRRQCHSRCLCLRRHRLQHRRLEPRLRPQCRCHLRSTLCMSRSSTVTQDLWDVSIRHLTALCVCHYVAAATPCAEVATCVCSGPCAAAARPLWLCMHRLRLSCQPRQPRLCLQPWWTLHLRIPTR